MCHSQGLIKPISAKGHITGTGCSLHSPRWLHLQVDGSRWAVRRWCFAVVPGVARPPGADTAVLTCLGSKPLKQQQHILLSFAAIDLDHVKNLSAYLNCLIKEHESTNQVCDPRPRASRPGPFRPGGGGDCTISLGEGGGCPAQLL